MQSAASIKIRCSRQKIQEQNARRKERKTETTKIRAHGTVERERSRGREVLGAVCSLQPLSSAGGTNM